jgi:putative phosphoribosyl transferase
LKFELPGFQIRFKDRQWAGKILASAIKEILNKSKISVAIDEIIVLSIPRGGVVVADALASKLPNKIHFDIVVSRKLSAPDNKEVAIGAVMDDGTTYINHEIYSRLGVSHEYLKKEKDLQLGEILRRNTVYGNAGTNRLNGELIGGKIVVLVDDGAATGSTLIISARSIRALSPSFLIIAVPVAPRETVESLKKEADVVEVITCPPSAKFKSVGQYYQNFKPVSDEEVIRILQDRQQ